MAAIPDVISESAEDVPLIDGGIIPDDEGGPPALPSGAICDADGVAMILQSGFGWIADLRKRDCYRLDDEKALRLAEPWTPVVNNMWQKFAPMLFQQFALANPALFSAILTTAVVVGPMVSADIKQTNEERSKRRTMVQPGASHGPQAVPSQQPSRNGMIWAEGAAQPA